MRALYVGLKDLRQLVGDPKMVAFILLMPIVFACFMGMMMGGKVSSADERPLVAWVDQDASAISRGLMALLKNDGAIRLQEMAQADAEAAVRKGGVAAAVVVPSGLYEALQRGVPSELQVLAADASESNAQAAANLVQAAAQRLTAAARAARLSQAESVAWQPFADGAAGQAYLGEGMARASELWAVPVLSLRVTSPEPAGPRVATGFAQSSPGMFVQFSIFAVMSAAAGLVVERQSGALRRLLTTPISKPGLLAGKLMAPFVTVSVQGLILVVVSQVAFGLRYLASPLATLAIVGSLGFCLAGLGLLVGSLAKSDNAAVAASLILMFILSGLGGAWFPLEIAGPTFAAVGHLLPSAWAMDGFHSILLRGAGLSGVLVPVGALLAYGLGFFIIAAWRFRFE